MGAHKNRLNETFLMRTHNNKKIFTILAPNLLLLWAYAVPFQTVNPLYNDTVCPQIYDVKLNFCCYLFKFKLNWYICAKTIDVVKNFAVIKNVAIKSFHCM